jgi:hypothetical protein
MHRPLRFPECLSRILVLEAVQQRDAALKCRLRRVVSGVLEIYGSERVGMRSFLIGLPCDGRRGQTGNQRENSEFHEGPLFCLTIRPVAGELPPDQPTEPVWARDDFGFGASELQTSPIR